MLRRIAALVLCLCAFAACACAEEDLLIVHATDMHYLSPTLIDDGEAFMQIIRDGDGKVTHYSPDIVRAFVAEMLELQPAAVILSGDLTLNGAEQSHSELAEILRPLQEANIQVLALPGNHDSGGTAYSFGADGSEPFEAMTDERFDDVYASFGYDGAIARDSASMSYIAQISPKVWCLMVDVNANGTLGTVQRDTLAWIEEQLRLAQQEGVTVIAVSHQPLLQHNRLFTFGYVINNSSQLLSLYEEYGVQLNLSGHLHMQHILRSGALTEVAGSSLAVSPNQYGLVRIRDGRLLDYSTRPLNVAAWAQAQGVENPDLLDFAAYSAAFFDATTYDQTVAMLESRGVSPEEIALMANFAVEANRGYFAGTLTGADATAVALWNEYMPDTFFSRYLQSIADDATPKVYVNFAE